MPKRTVSPNPRRDRPAVQSLVNATRQGGVTLVLGAGVSTPRGIPKWDKLAKVVWQRVFPSRSSPWIEDDHGQLPQAVPQFLPIVFELVYRELGEAKFFEVLQECLYANATYPVDDRSFGKSTESLAVVARVIVNEYKRRQRRRVDAVITFNADDLIEKAVFALQSDDAERAVHSVARSTHFLPAFFGANWIPVYHIHGFLPSKPPLRSTRELYEIYEHMLVFTDVQYWSTSAGAMSFANRIMASALSEGRCIFIGLSMTDINLLRWLALRTLERDRDDAEGRRRATWVGSGFERSLRLQFVRHFWIRPDSNDPSGFLSEFLRLRGVESIQIPGWYGESFSRLMRRCFP